MPKQRKLRPISEGAASRVATAAQPGDVILSLSPEPAPVEEPLSPLPAPPPAPADAAAAETVQLQPDFASLPGAEPEIEETSPASAFVPPRRVLRAPTEADLARFGTEARYRLPARPARPIERLGQWCSPRVLRLVILGLALLVLALVFSAWSTSAAGTIYPDWGLASPRIGVVAAALGSAALLVYLVALVARVRPLPAAGGLLGLVLVIVGAGGIFGASSLARLQGLWYEGRGQDGLAQAAYQASGASLSQSGDLARISIEWAEQLGAQRNYSAAVAQLAPVARLYKSNAALLARAQSDLIQDYLAWGDQARQQSDYSAALAHYQALQQASYCAAACQAQVHAHTAQALLGLAQQQDTREQYDQAVATYQQLVQDYGDTPQAEQAGQALSAPQMITGTLVNADKTPAKDFEVLLASRWSFNASTQVFTLLGQQYRAPTDASGAFVVPFAAVGQTYMIAWVNARGQAGTCYTTNNQPLYTVVLRPLRAADAGSINIECV